MHKQFWSNLRWNNTPGQAAAVDVVYVSTGWFGPLYLRDILIALVPGEQPRLLLPGNLNLPAAVRARLQQGLQRHWSQLKERNPSC